MRGYTSSNWRIDSSVVVAMIAFLIAVISAYIGAQQLRPFGAEIYTVDLVAIGVLRELGPMLASIISAGRSGSAITAQLGVMRVTEEVEALQVMGISVKSRSRTEGTEEEHITIPNDSFEKMEVACKALDIQQAGAIARFHTRLEGTADVSRVTGCDVCVLADRAGRPSSEWQGDEGLALIQRLMPYLGAAPMVCAGSAQAGVMQLALGRGDGFNPTMIAVGIHAKITVIAAPVRQFLRIRQGHGKGIHGRVVAQTGADVGHLLDQVELPPVRHGLFAVDVLAGLAGFDERDGVPVVGRGDDHRVHVHRIEHLAVVAACAAVLLRRKFFRALHVYVGDRHDAPRGRQPSQLVRTPSSADVRDPHLIARRRPPARTQSRSRHDSRRA